jgi:hypothetical protein
MPDPIFPEHGSENLKQPDAHEVVDQTGGVNMDANDVTVGQDVVGRDKVIQYNIERYYADSATPADPEEHIAREESVRGISKRLTKAKIMSIAVFIVIFFAFALINRQSNLDSSTNVISSFSGYEKVGDSQLLLVYPLRCQDFWDNSPVEVRWKVLTQTPGQTQYAVLDDNMFRSDPTTVSLGTKEYSTSFEDALRRSPSRKHTWYVVINGKPGPSWEFHYKRIPEPPTCLCQEIICLGQKKISW